MIVNIDITRILPHTNNPRKDLGDLTELAESIKTNGILQNLTVVPKDVELYQKKINSKKAYTGEYTAIIGHRRLMASKLAGLKEVPCSISEMDEKTQIATMLLENMQRSDLTIWEQAQGFQMMLDLGETIFDISDKTGFSESTVRRRVKLLDLDNDKFRDSVMRGATLQDYIELDKIKDIELKNSVLEKIGTSNFQYSLRNAIDKEKTTENKNALIVELKKFAVLVENTSGLRIVQYISFYNTTSFKKPDDTNTTQYYFYITQYNIQLLKEATLTESEKEINDEQQKIQEQRSRLDEISKRAYQLRFEFVKNYVGRKKDIHTIMEFAVKKMINASWKELDIKLLIKMLELVDSLGEDEEFSFEIVSKAFTSAPERILFVTSYCSDMDSERWKYYDYKCKYIGSDDLDTIYDALLNLGYKISDEENALRDGTHELFVREDKNGE